MKDTTHATDRRPSEAERRGIDDAGRLHEINDRRDNLSVFELELLEGLRLLTQRVGEVGSAIEALGGRL